MLNLLRHGGVEYVTDNDVEVLHSTKSYGVVRRWLCKVVYVPSARKLDGISFVNVDLECIIVNLNARARRLRH